MNPNDGTMTSPDPGHPATVFDDVITRSVIDCLAVHGCSAQHTEADLRNAAPYTQGAVLAFIGFFGTKVTGTLLFALPANLAKDIAEAKNPDGVTELARLDSLAELANELLGRIKNRLVPYGVSFQIGIPKAIFCAGLWLQTRPAEGHRAHRFTSERGDVQVWFDAVLSPEFGMVAPSADGAQCVQEGELVIF